MRKADQVSSPHEACGNCMHAKVGLQFLNCPIHKKTVLAEEVCDDWDTTDDSLLEQIEEAKRQRKNLDP